MQEDDDEDRDACQPQDDVTKHGASFLAGRSRVTAVGPKIEPSRDGIVPMIPATEGGPPCGAQRKDATCRGYKIGEKSRPSGFIRCLAGSLHGFIDTLVL